MKIKRNFKDSVFNHLFSNPDLLRELYCALEGVTLPENVPVSINTLKNVFVMGRYNDISFEIGGKLVVLIEHQSTVNPNIALRMFQYVNEIFERMIKGKDIYSGRAVPLPYPEFFVLYNGSAQYPDEKIVKLSDLFENPQSLGLPGKSRPLLELEVRVLNINEGRNEEIVKRCSKLSEYSKLIGKVESILNETKDLKKAAEEAIEYCKKNGILKEYLEKYGKEVLKMLYAKWNLKDALAVAREEGREDGRDEGRNERDKEIARNLLSKGSTFDYVSEITGLTLEEVTKIKDKN